MRKRGTTTRKKKEHVRRDPLTADALGHSTVRWLLTTLLIAKSNVYTIAR